MRKGDKEFHIGCFGGYPVYTQFLYQYWYWVGDHSIDIRELCDAVGRDRIPFPGIADDAHPKFALALLETGVVRHRDRIAEAFEWIEAEIGVAEAIDIYQEHILWILEREQVELYSRYPGLHPEIPF